MKFRLFFCIYLFCLTNISSAQENAKGVQPIKKSAAANGHSFGLIIGISEYVALPKLQFADDDAENFSYYLKQTVSPSDSGNISLFTNQNATRDAITDKLYEITEQIKSGDKVYLYFSGHGDIEQLIQTDNCLLLLSNSPAKNYLRKSNTYLDINLFKTFFQTWSSKQVKVVFVCDACHSGSLVGGDDGRKNTLLSLQQSWSNEIKLFSCQPDEVSLEGKQWGGGRGLFSYFFVLGLKGMADKNNNAEVTLFELDNYLKEKVGTVSDQSQIPLIQGDLKWVMSAVNKDLFVSAKKEFLGTDQSQIGSLALRGEGNGLSDLIKDASDKNLYMVFHEKIKKKQLLDPEKNCALFYFNSLARKPINKLILNQMRIQLIESLQKSYDILLDFVYNDSYEKLGSFEKIQIETDLNTALQLTQGKQAMTNNIKSKILFLQACEITNDIMPNSISYSNTEKLNTGIDLLQQAIKTDSFSPNLYLKLGDYYLYSNKITEAIKAYQHYQQLLPNDEYSYNKLGLAYMSAKDYNNAVLAFKKAIKINSQFERAAENLRIALKKING